MIDIKYGKAYGDETSEYLITYSDGMTVGEFIEEWLKNEREWGYFGIYYDPKKFTLEECREKGISLFGYPCCEYAYGKIKGDTLPSEYLDKQIIGVSGSGGWTRSDFMFRV